MPVCQPKMKGTCYQEVQRHCYPKVRSYQVAKVMLQMLLQSCYSIYLEPKKHKIFSLFCKNINFMPTV